MTKVEFFSADNLITGYKITGHSTDGADDLNGKIVCSAVSSAAYMTANTLSEIVGAQIDSTVSESLMKITVISKLPESQTVLSGLKLHLVELSKDFPKNITIISEV